MDTALKLKALFVGLAMMWNNLFAQKLEPGTNAPVFNETDAYGHSIDLESYKGQKLLLAFFRYVSCPVCNFRTHELTLNHDAITAKGYTVIAVFESDNQTLKEYLEETKLPFTVIGNPSLSLYRRYGVQKSAWRTFFSVFSPKTMAAALKGRKLLANMGLKRDGALTRLPADFVIDENGMVQVAYYGKNIGDHLPLIDLDGK